MRRGLSGRLMAKCRGVGGSHYGGAGATTVRRGGWVVAPVVRLTRLGLYRAFGLISIRREGMVVVWLVGRATRDGGIWWGRLC